MPKHPPAILIVEDHDDTLRLMVNVLKKKGFDVQAVHSGDEARALIASGWRGLLISDLELGEESGFELMREIRARYGLRGIAVSGHVFPRDVQAAMAAGFDKFVAKPFELDVLLQAIDALIAAT